jgi:hypothetical protein
MAINKEGVELLKADLRANAAAYRQNSFGTETTCGTVMCMAGFCRIREVGQQQYSSEVMDGGDALQDLCLESGIRQLGIEDADVCCPPIFEMHFAWPYDLKNSYQKANTDDKRVEVACSALDRLQDDGSIAEEAL